MTVIAIPRIEAVVPADAPTMKERKQVTMAGKTTPNGLVSVETVRGWLGWPPSEVTASTINNAPFACANSARSVRS